MSYAVKCSFFAYSSILCSRLRGLNIFMKSMVSVNMFTSLFASFIVMLLTK